MFPQKLTSGALYKKTTDQKIQLSSPENDFLQISVNNLKISDTWGSEFNTENAFGICSRWVWSFKAQSPNIFEYWCGALKIKIFYDLLHESTYLDDYFKFFTPKSTKIFLVMSGIFYNNCGELTSANFSQILKMCAFFPSFVINIS